MMGSVYRDIIEEGNGLLKTGIKHLRRNRRADTSDESPIAYTVLVVYDEGTWIATCEELRITLAGNSLDALIARFKVAVQDVVETEMNEHGTIQLTIVVQDKIEKIKAAS